MMTYEEFFELQLQCEPEGKWTLDDMFFAYELYCAACEQYPEE